MKMANDDGSSLTLDEPDDDVKPGRKLSLEQRIDLLEEQITQIAAMLNKRSKKPMDDDDWDDTDNGYDAAAQVRRRKKPDGYVIQTKSRPLSKQAQGQDPVEKGAAPKMGQGLFKTAIFGKE